MHDAGGYGGIICKGVAPCDFPALGLRNFLLPRVIDFAETVT
jgi:hypothetical protein